MVFLFLLVSCATQQHPTKEELLAFVKTKKPLDFTIPIVDLDKENEKQFVVDKENNVYLGHPTTVLLGDGKTVLVVYPQGHGKGPIYFKKSTDGGKTWSERLPTPESWKTSLETPTLFRTVDAHHKKHLILFSGLYPIRMSYSNDEGKTWSELKKIGNFGGIVAMSSCIPLKKPGYYMAFFHDDGRFIHEKRDPTQPNAVVYSSLSRNAGLTWEAPKVIASYPEADLCEPGAIRSPDGNEIALLMRENSRRFHSFVTFSNDEGLTWTKPEELPSSLTGDRHVAKYSQDGRLFVTFRDMAHLTPTRGDWVGWVGHYSDLHSGNQGEYRVRIKDNKHPWDCCYPGLELLPDGDFLSTTYGHWIQDAAPFIMSVRFSLADLDQKLHTNAPK